MRLIGHLLDETQARRFTSFLLVQGVVSRADSEPEGWAIWVRDEDQVPKAREALDTFRASPADAIYASAEAEALKEQRAILSRERVTQQKQIDMSRQWRSATEGPRPLTMTLAALSVLVFVLTSGGDLSSGNESLASILGDLTFCKIDSQGMAPIDGFTNIRQGEVWRLVTPIFIHFGLMHLIFNLMTLFWLASPIERSKGTPLLGAMTISIAVFSNSLQYLWTENPLFGGLSGVLFGLIGYSWLKARREPGGPIQMPSDMMTYTMVFFVLGILRDIPPLDTVLGALLPRMANTAHAVGLVMGLAFVWVPAEFKRLRSR